MKCLTIIIGQRGCRFKGPIRSGYSGSSNCTSLSGFKWCHPSTFGSLVKGEGSFIKIYVNISLAGFCFCVRIGVETYVARCKLIRKIACRSQKKRRRSINNVYLEVFSKCN